jgi:acetate kinase
MDVVLVINAGSSSGKFSVFGVSGAKLSRICRGNFEEIDTKPYLRIRHESGENPAEKHWSAGEPLGHEGAIAYLFEWLHSHATGYRAIGAGHFRFHQRSFT